MEECNWGARDKKHAKERGSGIKEPSRVVAPERVHNAKIVIGSMGCRKVSRWYRMGSIAVST